MSLGEQLVVFMTRAKLNRKQVAEMSGMTTVTLRKILGDDESVTLSMINKVAKSLGVKIKYTVE